MELHFSKMHGLGNDFVVINAVNQQVELTPGQIRLMANRRFGVGCDQVLLVEPPQTPDTEFFYRIYNADGSEAEQCGNGARCFARYVHDKGLTDNTTIDVGTTTGTIQLILDENGQVKVNMGPPRLVPEAVPFEAEEVSPSYTIDIDERSIEIGVVSMGNPHAVFIVDNADTAEVETLGPALESHARFPQRVNVGFMEIASRHLIRLRVFERGAGETLACGTGACAAVVSGRLRGLLDEEVVVQLPGGALLLRWQGDEEPVWMTGPATFVFDGTIDL